MNVTVCHKLDLETILEVVQQAALMVKPLLCTQNSHIQTDFRSSSSSLGIFIKQVTYTNGSLKGYLLKY